MHDLLATQKMSKIEVLDLREIKVLTSISRKILELPELEEIFISAKVLRRFNPDVIRLLNDFKIGRFAYDISYAAT